MMNKKDEERREHLTLMIFLFFMYPMLAIAFVGVTAGVVVGFIKIMQWLF